MEKVLYCPVCRKESLFIDCENSHLQICGSCNYIVSKDTRKLVDTQSGYKFVTIE